MSTGLFWLYLLAPFSGKVRSETSSHRILRNHTVSNLSNLISLLSIFGRGRALPVLSLGLRDFLPVGSSTNKLYNDKWWPQHARACRRTTSSSVVTNFDSTRNSQSKMTITRGCLLPCTKPETKLWLDRIAGLLISSGTGTVFLFEKLHFKCQRFLPADQLH